MRHRHGLPIPILVLAFAACSQPELPVESPAAAAPSDTLWEQADLRFDPLPATAPNPDNPVTVAKVELGKLLYYDPRLSKDGNVSCNSCHDLATFGVDHQPTSDGDDGSRGDRNSPTVLNAALHQTQFWDGRAKNVEEQAGMPILNPVEMAIPSKEFLVERLAAVDEYRQRFAEAFPDDEEPLSYANIERALGAFERTLLTPSRFDAYLEGDREALTAQEQAGLRKFIELGCATCHGGVNLGAFSFQRFGLQGPYWEHTNSDHIDEGRYKITGDEADKFVFRVASLRNVEKTAPYFHDGSVATLDEAIRVMLEVQLGLEISDAEIDGLVAFLRSVTGEVPPQALTTAS